MFIFLYVSLHFEKQELSTVHNEQSQPAAPHQPPIQSLTFSPFIRRLCFPPSNPILSPKLSFPHCCCSTIISIEIIIGLLPLLQRPSPSSHQSPLSSQDQEIKNEPWMENDELVIAELEDVVVSDTILRLASLQCWHSLWYDCFQMELLEKMTKAETKKAKKCGENYERANSLDATFLRNLVVQFLESWRYWTQRVRGVFSTQLDASEGINENGFQEVDNTCVLYCEKYMEFLIDLLSQLPTANCQQGVLKSDLMDALNKEVKTLDEDSWMFEGPRSRINLIAKPGSKPRSKLSREAEI